MHEDVLKAIKAVKSEFERMSDDEFWEAYRQQELKPGTIRQLHQMINEAQNA